MTDNPTTPKSLGDYGVEIEKAIASGNTLNVPPIAAEMRAAAEPPPPEPKPGEPVPPTKPPEPPVDLGLRGFADALDEAVHVNNAVVIRKLATDMIALQPPTPPPPAPGMPHLSPQMPPPPHFGHSR